MNEWYSAPKMVWEPQSRPGRYVCSVTGVVYRILVWVDGTARLTTSEIYAETTFHESFDAAKEAALADYVERLGMTPKPSFKKMTKHESD